MRPIAWVMIAASAVALFTVELELRRQDRQRKAYEVSSPACYEQRPNWAPEAGK